MRYTGKTAIITGAGSGIGHGIALMYAENGAMVIIADKDPFNGGATEEMILSKGGRAKFIRTDVSSPADISSLIKETNDLCGTIDILINNAGVSIFKPLFDLPVEEWDNILNINLRGMFLCSRSAAHVMKDHGGGSIVNIASTRAFMSEPGTEAYSASKGGVVALTHALAASLAPYRIRVNSISPGWIQTDDYDSLSNTDHAQHFSGRVGKPDDIARACLYLTDEGNEFINGTNIIIDGGMTRKMIYEP